MKWVIWVMKRVVRIILRSPVFPVGDGVVVVIFIPSVNSSMVCGVTPLAHHLGLQTGAHRAVLLAVRHEYHSCHLVNHSLQTRVFP